jgi:hypothetical protein
MGAVETELTSVVKVLPIFLIISSIGPSPSMPSLPSSLLRSVCGLVAEHAPAPFQSQRDISGYRCRESRTNQRGRNETNWSHGKLLRNAGSVGGMRDHSTATAWRKGTTMSRFGESRRLTG